MPTDTQTIDGASQITTESIVDSSISLSAAIQLSKLVSGTYIILADGTVAMIASLNMGSQKITNLLSPSSGTDAANKDYVDSSASAAKVYVDASDTTPDYLFNKLATVAPVDLSILNPGGNEIIQINVPAMVGAGSDGSPGLTPFPGTTPHDPPWVLGDDANYHPPVAGAFFNFSHF